MDGINKNPFARRPAEPELEIPLPRITAWQYVLGIGLARKVTQLPLLYTKPMSKRRRRRLRGQAKAERRRA